MPIKEERGFQSNNSNQNMTVSAKTVKEAVKLAVAGDDKSRNFMIYGLEEAIEGKEHSRIYWGGAEGGWRGLEGVGGCAPQEKF